MIISLLWPNLLAAHGPGRALNMEWGFCHGEQMERTLNLPLENPSAPFAFCYRLINREEFPVGVRLGILQGETNASNLDVCLVSREQSSLWNDGLFLVDGNPCRTPGLVLQAKERREIDGLWFFNPPPQSPGQEGQKHPDPVPMIRCVLIEAQPLREGDVHGRGFHVKNGRDINMVRLEGPPQINAAKPAMAQNDDPARCDQLSPVLIQRMEQAQKMSAKTEPLIEQGKENPSLISNILEWLGIKGWSVGQR
ncbi:MAG: hypothetical protein HQL84_09580 [Magnetococcales bacterium]|nr:hypothetical protein [Magnetococcales bacterium]MBF0150282.1 hypothetical protein [Magnetococcales bacterium]